MRRSKADKLADAVIKRAEVVARNVVEHAQRVASEVKEPPHIEIMHTLGGIEAKVDGINQRLDVSNGRIGKLEIRAASLEETRSEQRGGWKLFAMLGGASVLGGIGTFLASKIIK